MWSLVRADIRRHRASLAGVFVTLMVSTILLTGLAVLIESGIRGGIDPERYVGADVVVTGSQSLDVPQDMDPVYVERAPLPPAVTESLLELPGVADVIEDRTAPLSWDGTIVEAHDWKSAAMTPYRLTGGHEPEATDEVVVGGSRTVELGEAISLTYGGIPTTYTVVGIAQTDGPLPGRSEHVFLDEAQLTALNPDSKPAIGVVAKPGSDPQVLRENIDRSISGVDTFIGRARGDAEFLDAGSARSQLSVIGSSLAGTALLIAMFVVASTLALSIAGRRRDFALLRAVGATPRQIHTIVGREVVAIGILAAMIGVVPGYLTAGLLGSLFVRAGALPDDFALAYGPLPALFAVSTALVTARIAAYVAARRPARLAPTDALREASTTPARIGPWRYGIGAVFGIAGLAVALLPTLVSGEQGIAGAAGSAIMLMIAVGLLGPALVGRAVGLLSRTVGTSHSSAVVLAMINSGSNTRRLASAITPLALAVAIGSVQLFVNSTVATEAERQAVDGVTADLIVSAPAGLSPMAVEQVAAQNGVRSVNPVTRSQAYLTYLEAGDPVTTMYSLQGVDPAAAVSTMDLGRVDGDLGRLAGTDTVALSMAAASAVGADLDSHLEVRLGDGTSIPATVVAVYERGLGLGDITIDGRVVRNHTTSGLADSLLLSVDQDQVSSVADSLSGGGFSVADTHGLSAAGEQERSAQSWTSLIALAVLMGYLAVAVVNTLVMATSERSREFALMRLVGANSKQIRAMMRIEATIVTAVAAVIGTVIALPALMGVAYGISGQPWPTISPVAYGGIVALTAVLGFAATVGPTLVMLRSDPADSIGTRD